MNRVMALCPTRFRPKKLKEALVEFKANSVTSDIFFGFQDNDPDLEEYKQITKEHNHIILGDIGMTYKVNEMIKQCPGYDGYWVLNDDQMTRTPGYDKAIIEKVDEFEKEHGHRICIPYWRDGYNDGHSICQSYCTKEMRDILDGKYFPAPMRHYFSDNSYWFLGNQCNILIYMPEIFIEHLHWCVGKVVQDKTYGITYSQNWDKDAGLYYKWEQEGGKELVIKIKEKIGVK